MAASRSATRTPDHVAARTATFNNFRTPEAIAIRAVNLADQAKWHADHGFAMSHHRNGSGNGAPFRTEIADDFLVIQWPVTTREGDTPDMTVVVSIDDLAAADRLPQVPDGDKVAEINVVLCDPRPDRICVFVREAHSVALRRTDLPIHVDRKIVIWCPERNDNDSDRVAVLDLARVVYDRDASSVSNAWRPEPYLAWARQEVAR